MLLQGMEPGPPRWQRGFVPFNHRSWWKAVLSSTIAATRIYGIVVWKITPAGFGQTAFCSGVRWATVASRSPMIYNRFSHPFLPIYQFQKTCLVQFCFPQPPRTITVLADTCRNITTLKGDSYYYFLAKIFSWALTRFRKNVKCF